MRGAYTVMMQMLRDEACPPGGGAPAAAPHRSPVKRVPRALPMPAADGGGTENSAGRSRSQVGVVVELL